MARGHHRRRRAGLGAQAQRAHARRPKRARFEQMRSEALEVLDTDARIPYVRRRGDHLYNFWRDDGRPPRAVADAPRCRVIAARRRSGTSSSTLMNSRVATTRTGYGRAPPSSSRITRWRFDQPVARRIGRRDCARIRHAHARIRDGRIRATRGEDADQLGRRTARAARHRLRRGFAHRVRVSAARQALAPRAASGEAETVFSTASTDVIVAGGSVDRTTVSTDDAEPRHRLLQ